MNVRSNQKAKISLKKATDFSFDEIMLYMEQVRGDGNAFLIKLDGLRPANVKQYTALIGFLGNNKQHPYPIRADSHTLKEACQDVLRQYLADKKVQIKSASNVKDTRTILSRSSKPSINEILLRAEGIREEGNVFIIRSDQKGYSVSILYPVSSGKENVVAESGILIEACMNALTQHFSNKNTE